MNRTKNNVLNFLLQNTHKVKREALSSVIMAALIDLGFSPSRDGFFYLRQAIEHKSKNFDLRLNSIYQIIIDKYNGSVDYAQIDQAIRDAIKDAWNRFGKENWLNYFPRLEENNGKPPSNFSFISYMAVYIALLQEMDEKGE